MLDSHASFGPSKRREHLISCPIEWRLMCLKILTAIIDPDGVTKIASFVHGFISFEVVGCPIDLLSEIVFVRAYGRGPRLVGC